MAACDTAFVTFKTAADARLVKSEMSWIKTRDFVCQVRMAPDARDLDWDKLVQANFTGDVFRSLIVHTLVWAATIVSNVSVCGPLADALAGLDHSHRRAHRSGVD